MRMGTVRTALLASLLCHQLVDAGVFLRANVKSLRDEADCVVRGRVVDSRSEWNDERSMIYTFVTLHLDDVLHGNAENPVIVKLFGGVVDDSVITADGEPELNVGDDVILFLSRWPDGLSRVEGYFQGVSRVATDKTGNTLLRGGVADGLTLDGLRTSLRQR